MISIPLLCLTKNTDDASSAGIESMNMPAFLYCRCNIYITGFDTPPTGFPAGMQIISYKKEKHNHLNKKPTNVGFFILILQE